MTKKKKPAPGDESVEKEKTVETSKFDEFLTKLAELGISYDKVRYKGWGAQKTECDPYIRITWVTGGVTGGSCWDTGEVDNHRPREGDPEPEFDALDKILEHIAPKITFLQYKNLAREVITHTTEHQNDYYGNYTNYGVKEINLKKLFDELVDRGFIT